MLTQAQVYIEKHKITSLFEELMNKLVRNAPENPLIYLIKQLYKKAGLEIPQELKSTTETRRDSLNLTVFGHSSEIVSKSVALASWSGKPGETQPVPFLKREKSLMKSWQGPLRQKTPVEVSFSKTTKPVKGQKTEDKKEKPEWNSLTKVTTNTFDEYSKKTKGSPSKSRVESVSPTKDVKKSWALSGQDEPHTKQASHDILQNYPRTTQRKKLSEEELLLDELSTTSSLVSCTSQDDGDTSSVSSYIPSPRYGNCKTLSSKKRKEELERLILENQERHLEPSIVSVEEETDGAIELLENPSDLESEGVSSMSSAGFKLSKTLRQREDSQVKLNIKLYPSSSDVESMTSHSNYFSPHGRQHNNQENLVRSYKFDDSDEDIESASQVSANLNRKYDWNSSDSEEDSYVNSFRPQNYLDKQFLSKSLNGLQVSPNYLAANSSNPNPNYTVPVPSASPIALYSRKTKSPKRHQEESQVSLNREQLQKLKSNSIGWNVGGAAESDGSILSNHTYRF
ncbi:uncharacterized protein C8orf34 homolog isoform X1 [Argonauta hians]